MQYDSANIEILEGFSTAIDDKQDPKACAVLLWDGMQECLVLSEH